MANEAKVVEEYDLATYYTVANGTGLEQGSFMVGTDPQTAILHASANQNCVGVLRTEKIASDGITRHAIVKRGRILATISGTVTVGDALVLDASINHLKKQPNYNTISAAHIVGYAEETATSGQTAYVWLDPHKVVFA